MNRSLVRLLSLFLIAGMALPAVAQHVPLRPYDALLDDERLTAIVDAQSRRDAAFIEQMLGNEDAVVRARAALAAGSVQAESSLRPLIALLSDRSTAVRADAAFALGQLRDSTAARPLFDALSREDDARTRFHLHQALGETSGSVVARTFLAYDPERGEAWSYALALARIGLRGIRTDEVARRLLTFAGHPDAEARRHAAYFFWRVNNPDAWASIEPNLRAAFQRLDADDPAVGYLALALSARADVRDVHATGHLLENSASWQTRDRAARALGRHAATSPAFDMLMKGARDSVHHVAETSARSIGSMAGLTDEHIDAIRQRIDDAHLAPAVRAGLIGALVEAGSFDEALHYGNNDWTARYAAPVLARVPRPEAFQQLLAIARHEDDRVAAAGLSALITRWSTERSEREHHAAYFDAFSDAVRSLDVGRIYTAAPVLSDSIFVALGSPRLIRETFERFEMPRDVEAAIAIVQAANRIDHPDARHIVGAARRHEHPAVRRAAGTTDGSAPSTLRQPDWERLRAIGARPRLRFETERGTFLVQMFGDLAPVTVQTLVDFALEGRYDGIPFHRVVNDFVIQGGDFARRDGFGGPGFEIPSEFTPLRYAAGTAGMASAGKDTEGSQFFFTHSMQPHLDGRYTAFGVVIEGQDVVDAIRRDDIILGIALVQD